MPVYKIKYKISTLRREFPRHSAQGPLARLFGFIIDYVIVLVHAQRNSDVFTYSNVPVV